VRNPLLFALLLLLACRPPDTTPPEVRSSVPPDSAPDVVLNSAILVNFSEAMDQSATALAFSIDPTVTGAVTWRDGYILVFTPAALLDSGTTYTATISTAAQDLAGNALTAPYQFSFTTGNRVSFGRVYLQGRSVLEGWFNHWGWDGDDNHPVVQGRFTLFHRYVESPDDSGLNMVASVRANVAAIPPDSSPAVFFKLCFADFAGSDSLTAQANLERNRAIIDSVCEIVVTRHGYPLIVGNALPVTLSQSDYWLVWNHIRYNAFLDTLAAAHPGQVFIFDMYSVLADGNTHAIRPDYATGGDDPHPSAAGYTALDTPFFALLEAFF
jgi:hypothetical protein